MNDPRGSYWRKWDLHIHTPESFHWSGGKRFAAMTPAEKETSLKDIVKAINESDVAAFSIVDYWTFDGFEALTAYVEEGKAKLTKAVFPGMELRIEAPVDYRLNIQVLLSDKLTRQQRADFKAALRISGLDRGISEEALAEFGGSLSADKAAKHGFTGDYAQDSLQLLQLGSQTAEVSRESLMQAKKAIPPDTCLIILPYDTSDGLEKLDWETHPCADQYFMQSADMFETRTPSNVDLFLGRKNKENEKYFGNFLKTMGGKPKPAISGSDAHKIGDYGKFPGDRVTWIKADPTFAGLRKTLIEPQGRVFVGEAPEQLQNIDSRPTKFIDSISIGKKAGSTLPEIWFDCVVPINPGLVAIIGNKGSGKSALGETIGLLGKTSNIGAFSFLSTKRFRQPKSNKAIHFDGQLTWISGSSEISCLGKNPEPNAYELVKYIPQNYLEKLCNELGAAGETGFDEELRSVIFSHVKEEDRLGQNSLEELIEFKATQANRKIDILKNELTKITSKIVLLEKRASSEHRTKLEGALSAKENELDSHDKNKPSGVPKPETSGEQKEKFGALTKLLTEKKEKVEKAELEIAATKKQIGRKNLLLAAANRLLSLIESFEMHAETFSREAAFDIEALGLKESAVVSLKISKEPVIVARSTLLAEKAEFDRELDTEEESSQVAKHTKATTELAAIQSQLDAPHKAYETYLSRKTTWEKIRKGILGSKDKSESIEFYKAQIEKLKIIPQDLAFQREKAGDKSKQIFQEKNSLAETYRELYSPVQNFINSSSVAKEELQLRFKVEITDTGFTDTFFSYVSQGVRGTYCGADEGRKSLGKLLADSDLASVNGVANFVEQLVESLLVDGRDGVTATEVAATVRKGQSPETLYNFIYALDYLRPRYSLGMSGMALEELSPGERGALLLVFYLLVDQNDAPLIIDQPEENLDNQTVFKLLVPCIKEAKKRRQIILITHNPNLAVVCDAEQIICCSIDKHDGHRLTYTAGAIENPIINKHIVDILEGTRPAFDNRGAKYVDSIGIA